MANYNIDIKAKVNVSQVRQSIREELAKTTIRVAPKFDVFADDNHIKQFRNQVANILERQPVPITLAEPTRDNVVQILGEINKKFIITPTLKFSTDKGSEFIAQLNTIKQAIDEFGKNSKAKVSFDVDPESYNQLFKILDSIKQKQNIKFGFDSEDKKIFNTDITNIKKQEDSISNVNIGLGFNQEQKERLGNEILTTKAFLESFNADKISIGIQDDQLAQLKNNIENYFQNNPIVLTISQDLNDIDLGSISNKVAELLELQSEVLEQQSEQQQKIIQETTNIQEEATNAQIQRINEIVEQFKNEEITLETLKSNFEDIRNVAENFGLESIINALDKSTQEVDEFIQKTNEIKEASDSISFYQEQLNYLWENLEKGSLTSQQVRESLNELFDLAQREDIFNFDKLEETSSQGLESIQYKFERLYQWLEECDDEELKSQIEKFKALEVQYQKHLVEKRELRDKENKENEHHMHDAILIENKFRNDRIENEKSVYDERIYNLLNFIDRARETAQETVNIEENANAEIERIKTEGVQQAEEQILVEEKAEADYQNERVRLRWEASDETRRLEQQAREDTKAELHEEVNDNKTALNEKKADYLDYAETIKKISQETTQEIDNQAKQSKAVEIYYQQIQEIVKNFREGFINIEQAEDQIWEKMSEAKKEGIIPQEVFDNTKKLLNNLEEETEKSFDDWRKKQEKLYQDLQVSTEKQKKYDEKIWEDKAKSVQEMYDKQQISAEQYINRINSLLPEAYEKGYDGAEKYAKAVDKVEKEQEEAGQSADTLGNKVNNLGSRFDNVFNSLMRYFGVTKIFDAVQNSFSKMVQEVRDLDTELTEFSKVSNLSAQETEIFIDNAYRLGETVAKTGTDVVTATTLFKKMGYEVEQSMDFAKDALMWTNVADGMVSVEEAANMLISTMKAYGEEAVSTTQIIDALNEVSNNYSTSSSALSNNLSTVAATLAASGTDLYQTIGLMTAGIEVMPDKASKVANGLKTISQRIRQIDGDTADKLDEFLGSKGKSRFDETTRQLRSTYDILSEVSELWNDLSINERQYIGEVMAGKNQITVLNALMTNFATAVDATGTAMQSTGSAIKENERVLNSIQGHINGFKSAFSELSKDLISSDLFKNVVDVGTFLIKIIDVIASNPLTKSGFFLLISMLGSNSILNNIEKIGNRIGDILSMIEGFPSSLDPISLGITAIIALLGIAYNVIHKSNEEVEQAKQNIIDAQKKEEESIDSKIKKYEELQKKYNLENLTREEQIEILRQINELNEGDYLVHGDINEEIRLQNEKLYIQKSLLAGINEEASKSAISFDSGFLGIKDATRSLLDLNESISSVVFDKSGKIKYTDLINSEDISLNIKKDTLQGILDALDEIPVESRGLDWLNIYDTVSGDLKAIQGEVDNVNKYAKDAVTNMLQSTGRNIKTMTDEELGDLKKQIDGIKEKSDIIFTISTDPDQIEQLGKMIDSEITARAQAASTATSDEIGIVEASLSGAMAMMSNYVNNMELLNQAHMEFVDSGEISAETLRKIADAGLEAYLIIDEETKSLDVNRDAFWDDNKSIEENAIVSYVAGQRTKLLADLKNESTAASNQHASASDDEKAAVNNLSKALENAVDETSTLAATQMLLNQIEAEGITTTDESGKALDSITSKITNFISETKTGIKALHTLFDTASTSSGRTGTSHSVSHGSGSGSSSSRSSTSTSDREAEKAQREAEQAAKDAQKAWKDGFDALYKELKTYLDMGAITEKEYYDALETLVDKFYKDREGYEEEYWKYHDEIIKGRKKYLEEEMADLLKQGETLIERQLDANVISQEEYFDALEELYKTYYTDQEELEEHLYEIQKQRYEYQIQEIDKQIKAYEDELNSLFNKGEGLLQHQLDMDEITEEEYLNLLEEFYKASITDQEELEQKLLDIKERKYKLEKQKQEEHLKELEKQLQEYYDEAQKLHEEYVKSLEDDAESIDAVISYAIDVLDEEISKLEQEKEALDEANDALEEQIKLQELEENLQQAKNRKVRVYRKGQGFVYQEDTKAVSEAQSAIDEYKKELAHKKEVSMIDERIKELQKYKEAWSSIPKEYKKAQNELLAMQRAGSDAQKRILAGDKNFIDNFAQQYSKTQDKIKEANKRNIDEINAFIFGTEQGAGLKQKIEQINTEINKVKSIDIGAQFKAGTNNSDQLANIIARITTLNSTDPNVSPIAALNQKKIELQAQWKTTNGTSQYTTIISNIQNIQTELDKITVKDLNITNWVNNIDTMIKKLEDLTQAAKDASSAGIDVGEIGEDGDSPTGPSGGRTDGYSVGDWVTIPDSDISYAPFKGKRFKIVQFENQDQTYNPTGDYVALLVEGGTEGEVTYRVPVSHLNGGSDTITGTDPGDGPAGKTVVKKEPREGWIKSGEWGIVGYEITYSDGTKIYEELYARGTLGTTSKTFMVNEDGMEAMVTPEGTVISAPSTGYGVIKNEYTERLTDFAADPLKFLNKTFSGYSGTYQNNQSKNEIININGNLTLPNVTNGESFVDSIKTLALQYTTRR